MYQILVQTEKNSTYVLTGKVTTAILLPSPTMVLKVVDLRWHSVSSRPFGEDVDERKQTIAPRRSQKILSASPVAGYKGLGFRGLVSRTAVHTVARMGKLESNTTNELGHGETESEWCLQIHPFCSLLYSLGTEPRGGRSRVRVKCAHACWQIHTVCASFKNLISTKTGSNSNSSHETWRARDVWHGEGAAEEDAYGLLLVSLT